MDPNTITVTSWETPDKEELQDKPWRYIGYKLFSEWTASSDDFFVIRRFSTIATRVILRMQWEISKLENELSAMDHERMFEIDQLVNNGAFECDDEKRKEVLNKILERLRQYYDFVSVYSALRGRSAAGTASKANVQGWLRDHPGAISKEEAAFADHPYIDLMDVVEHPRSPLRKVLEKMGVFKHRRFSVFRRMDAMLPETIATGTVHYAEEKIDAFVNGVLCIAGFSMIAVPLWVLFALGDRKKLQLGVITLFIGLFLLGVQSASSKTLPFESLAATAAYSAVLMVFMQMGS